MKTEKEKEEEEVEETKDEPSPKESKKSTKTENPPQIAPLKTNPAGEGMKTSTKKEEWFHFEESVWSWLPVPPELQTIFDTGYEQAKQNPNNQQDYHFLFQMRDIPYAIKFDFRSTQPFGVQFQVNFNKAVRNVIKACPDSEDCINGFKVTRI